MRKSLWASAETREGTERYPGMGRLSWRKALSTQKWESGVGVSLDLEFRTETPLARWRVSRTLLGVTVTKSFSLGPSHGWYDGPHCSFSLGFLHLVWDPADCEKCRRDR